ncbi:phage holin family protein [Gordonia aurantiaca]|uniref:phage holin family protein n=1 Tax=Gordonia sp. B21 TaxID=3151852 RepID=UPI003266CFDA
MVAFLVRTASTAVALWVATLIVPGIDFVGGDNTAQKIGIALVVAVVFGLVNAFVKPIVQFVSIPFYILTLGLVHIVINALMLELTAWITRNTTHWGLEVESFWWSAIFGAIVVSVVGWLLALVMREPADR